MAIQRASRLYPVNTTTVDTGTGIDVRLLDDVQAGADDTSQSANFDNTNDNVERTFDPATGGVTNTNNANTTLFKTGWALELTPDMTPTDDTTCNAMLTAGTLTVSLRMVLNLSGATYVTATFSPTIRASLWRYVTSTDTGTLIASGTTTSTSWGIGSIGSELGTDKIATISIVISSDSEFLQNEIMLLQVGFNTGTVPDPTIGTGNFVLTLKVDNIDTFVDFTTNQGIRQTCPITSSITGKGVVTKNALAIGLSRSPVGKGVITSTKATVASKSFAITGKGVVDSTKSITKIPINLVGKGVVDGRIEVPIDEIPTGGGGGSFTFIG